MKASTLLFVCPGVSSEGWVRAIRSRLPELEVRVWPEVGHTADVDYAFVWKHPAGLLRSFPNLKGILSLGAGVESILRDPELPPKVPVVRMVDPGLAVGMNEFVLMRVLHYHRRMPEHERFQKEHRWVPLTPPLPEQRPVGIMGLGELGARCATTLAGLGFDTAGWTRRPKTVPGVKNFHGPEGLKPFLRRTEILVCLLPLTSETADILNRSTLSELPRGAFLINVGRGAHLVDADLLEALERGQLAGATLDVFREEPLPLDHSFWDHPAICVVPHVAAITQIETAADTLVENLRRHLSGRGFLHVADRRLGY
ncbi:MAG: 2-hydroxyacid dehydrogenase [Vicinamibacteria bacterium]